jgi:hypothetical protein
MKNLNERKSNLLTNDEIEKAMRMLKVKIVFDEWSDVLVSPYKQKPDVKILFDGCLEAVSKPYDDGKPNPGTLLENYLEALVSSYDDMPDMG